MPASQDWAWKGVNPGPELTGGTPCINPPLRPETSPSVVLLPNLTGSIVSVTGGFMKDLHRLTLHGICRDSDEAHPLVSLANSSWR
jgi:hypothetical protein